MRTLQGGLLYFALVFGTGFLMGAARVAFVAPQLGARRAELIELPIMVLVTVFAARWIIRRLAIPAALPSRLGMGGVGLALMLVAEFGLVLWLRGLTIREYWATRDPISATAYYAALVLFAIMPAVAWRT